MRITVTAKPKKKRTFIKQTSLTEYIVAVAEPAEQGKANQAIIKALSEYFGIRMSDIELISGQTSHQKIFAVPDSLANFEVLPKQKKLF